MNRYFFLPVVFVFLGVEMAEVRAYLSVVFAIFGAACCVADLRPLGLAVSNNRGPIVCVIFVLMILSVPITF